MQGSLKQVPLPEVLQFISMGKPSGLLTLRKGNNEITLYIQNGRIINSSSIERRRRLGDLLVNRGLLKRSELSRILNLQKTVESDKRLGTILVERDIVPEETIRETLRLQLEEEVWSLFAWEEGEFRFDTVESERQLGDAIVSIEIEPLILEGTRRNDEWQEIQTVIPHDRVVLTVAPLPADWQADLKLRPEEWKVLSQVNGRFTIRAVVNRSNMGRFEVHRILSQFVKTGLLIIREDQPDTVIAGYNPEGDSGGADTAPKAPVAVPKEKKSLLSSLIGGRKSERTSSGATGSLSFSSPISVVAWLVSDMVRRMKELKEYAPAQGDESLLERIWSDLVQTYTKADMIEVKQAVVDAARVEALFGACEYTEVIDDCFEDALEGLMNLLQTTFRVFSQRVGERAASRVVRELLDESAAQISVKNRGPFPVAERVQSVLRLAA